MGENSRADLPAPPNHIQQTGSVRSRRNELWQYQLDSLLYPVSITIILAGRLAENYTWDVQIIATRIKTAKLPIFQSEENLQDIFEKMMYLVRLENIREVWVQGEKVHSRTIVLNEI